MECEGITTCPRVASCFWEVCCRCGHTSSLHSMYICAILEFRRVPEAVWSCTWTQLLPEQRKHLAPTPHSAILPKAVSCAYQVTWAPQTMRPDTRGSIPPLSLVHCLTFLSFCFLIFHIGMMAPYRVITRETMAVKLPAQGRQSIPAFLFCLLCPHPQVLCEGNRRHVPASLDSALLGDTSEKRQGLRTDTGTGVQNLVFGNVWTCALGR